MSGSNNDDQPLLKLMLEQINQDIIASNRVLATLEKIKTELEKEHDGTTDAPSHYAELSLEHLLRYEKQVEQSMLIFMFEFNDLKSLLKKILDAKKDKLASM